MASFDAFLSFVDMTIEHEFDLMPELFNETSARTYFWNESCCSSVDQEWFAKNRTKMIEAHHQAGEYMYPHTDKLDTIKRIKFRKCNLKLKVKDIGKLVIILLYKSLKQRNSEFLEIGGQGNWRCLPSVSCCPSNTCGAAVCSKWYYNRSTPLERCKRWTRQLWTLPHDWKRVCYIVGDGYFEPKVWSVTRHENLKICIITVVW